MAERPDRYPWLDLLDVDGPFLSRPALDDVYDEAWPPRISNEHREILELPAALSTEWDEAAMAAVDRLLTEVLGYQEGRTLKFNPGTVIHPVYDNAAVSPHAAAFSRRDPDHPRLVVLAGPAASETPDALDPDAITTHYGWPSTAVQRAALAARGLGAELALVTNGYQHLVVWVGSGITGHAWVDPSLYRLDRRLADAFVALLSAPSVTTDADTSTLDLLRLSQEKQVDVTEKLGLQVRRAAESLVNAVSRANRNTDGKLLAGVGPDEVYAGVVTVLMRTVFLLNAEERDLISSGDLWDRAYSASELLDQLDDDHYRHQGVMRRRHGAWLRMLAAARAVHGGVNHSQMNVPAYGGNLFDPLRHSFLEGIGVDGQTFDVGVVDDATVRHVLDLLQRLNGQRLSYRAFSVEQIGQVYESLLDHSAVSVPEGHVVLGLVGARGAEPEVDLADVEEQHARGTLAAWLATNHDPSSGQGKLGKWQARIDRTPDDRVTATLAQACHGEGDTLSRVETFASLLRTDARGVALVFLPGDVYVTETANRRDTGTAYTSREFAAEIAHHALEHLVYEPGPHNEEDESKWQIKRPEEILELRVCDPAVGSGAILVAAVRYLSDKLVESRLEHAQLTERELETAATDPMATAPHVEARRDVVSQCVYGVDQDPMAVEMAKLSLWLVTVAANHPFTFVDHAIRNGDSLVGITDVRQLTALHLVPGRSQFSGDGGLFSSNDAEIYEWRGRVDATLERARRTREELGASPVSTIADADQKLALLADAESSTELLKQIADAVTIACFDNVGDEKAISEQLARVSAAISEGRIIEPPRVMGSATRRPMFHWPLEFPEVFLNGKGFDAMVGNPPFVGGNNITKIQGKRYRDFLHEFRGDGASGAIDLVAFFFLLARSVANTMGFIATSSITQGATRAKALGDSADHRTIFRAVRRRPWPGKPGLLVSLVWMAAKWDGSRTLDGQVVEDIDAMLLPGLGLQSPLPTRPESRALVNVGSDVNGKGFYWDLDQAATFAEQHPEEAALLRPIFTGQDFVSGPDPFEVRRVSPYFGELPLEAASARAPQLVKRLENTVRTERKNSELRSRFWQYKRPTQDLYDEIERSAGAIVGPYTSNTLHFFATSRTDYLYTVGAVVFPRNDFWLLGLVNSSVHRVWALRVGGALASFRYIPSDCFGSFPLIDEEYRDSVAFAAREYDGCRQEALERLGIGATRLEAMLLDGSDTSLADYRKAQVALDLSVSEALRVHHPELEDYSAQETVTGRKWLPASRVTNEWLAKVAETLR